MAATEAQAEAAITTLKRWINAAENSNQNGEDMVVMAAAAPAMWRALNRAQDAVQQLCWDQDPENECWMVLNEIRDAIKVAGQ